MRRSTNILGSYRDMRVLTISEKEIKPFNPDGRLFHNLNTPEDWGKVNGLKTDPMKGARV